MLPSVANFTDSRRNGVGKRVYFGLAEFLVGGMTAASRPSPCDFAIADR